MKTQLILATLAAITLNGCANSHESAQRKSFNLAGIQAEIAAGQATPQESAEELALGAEQLAQTGSITYAVRLAKDALTIDPNNTRAKLWNALLAPSMELKGIMTRLEPMAKANSRRYRGYLEVKTNIEQNTPVKSVKDFFFNGPKDIQSEDEIQDTISAITLRMDELRQTVKSLKTEELTVYRNPATVSEADRIKEAQRSCYASSENGTIILHGCDLTNAYQVKLNGADFEVMQQTVAGYQVYVGVLNSYSVHGLVDSAEAASNNHWSKQDFINAVVSDSKFGTLHDGRTLAVIPDLTIDAVMGARSALQLEQEMCANQGGMKWSRPGYLVSEGYCPMPDDEFDAALRTIEAMAKGPTAIFVNIKGQTKSTLVDAPKFLKNPTSNLRNLKPGQITSPNGHSCLTFADKTLNGLLPNADFDQLENADCQ